MHIQRSPQRLLRQSKHSSPPSHPPLTNTSPARLSISPPHTQIRTAFFDIFRRNKRSSTQEAADLRQRPRPPPSSRTTALAPGSILDTVDPLPAPSDGSPQQQEAQESAPSRNPRNMEPALNPKPVARARWQRKMVIRDIHKRGRISRSTLIARTERQSLSKSAMLATSVKKLGPLARQIAGKTVDEAIVQMRFSPKRVAREVLEHLIYARDEATVRRGMGLPESAAERTARDRREAYERRAAPLAWDRKHPKRIRDTGVVPVDRRGRPLPAPATVTATAERGVEVRDRKGKRRVVRDRKAMYVDQAWVGRGRYGKEAEFRARGRTNILRPPFTSISLLLKEEGTRVREHKEREAKAARKKTWVPLPDRPVPGQRQYLLW